MADQCYYNGTSYTNGLTICSGETSYACFDSRWSAQGSTCADSDSPVDWDVEEPDEGSTSENIGSLAPSDNLSRYNGRTYSQGAEICLNGDRYIASFGRWIAAGSCSTVKSSSKPNEYGSNTPERATESFDLCLGDGGGALVQSTQRPFIK